MDQQNQQTENNGQQQPQNGQGQYGQQPQYNQPQYGQRPQYPQPQYSQPAYGYGPQYAQQQPYQQQPIKPNNYMGLAIFCTLCCCLITGIIAIVKASNVNSYYAMRQYDAANLASQEAKNWCIWSIVLGIIVNIITFGFYGASIASLGLM
jgi:hypothetical protein